MGHRSSANGMSDQWPQEIVWLSSETYFANSTFSLFRDGLNMDVLRVWNCLVFEFGLWMKLDERRPEKEKSGYANNVWVK